MATVKDGKLRVDVARADCLSRSCYQLGFDKGVYVQGRGYVSYHKKERPVCMTRHLHGCPLLCTLEIDGPGATCRCGACGGITVDRSASLRVARPRERRQANDE